MLFSSLLGPLLLFGLVATLGCGKDPLQFLDHPDVETRVAASLSGTLTERSALTLANPELFSFAVFSDIHIKPSNLSTLVRFKQDIQKYDIAFFTVLGDLTEDGSNEEYRDVKADLAAVGIPYYATIGNHDLFQSGRAGGWSTWSASLGPATYAVTVADKIRLVFLDTSSDEVGESQFTWLEDVLSQPGPVTLVGSHYPIYDGTSPSIWRISSLEERMKLSSLLNRYNVHSYVGGHMHGFRESMVGSVHHFIVGSMFPEALDVGLHGYLLYTYDHGNLTYQRVDLDYALGSK